jgi:hypothetical protein
VKPLRRRSPAAAPTPWSAVIVPVLLAGGVGGLMLAELRTPWPLAALATLGVYFLCSRLIESLLLRSRAKSAPASADTAASGADTAPATPAVARLIGEARADAARIAACAPGMPDLVKEDMLGIVDGALTLCERLESDPGLLPYISRLLVFYLPSVRDLAEDRGRLAEVAGAGRLDGIDTTLDRVHALFASTARRLHEPELRAVDIDVRMLDRSLREDGQGG